MAPREGVSAAAEAAGSSVYNMGVMREREIPPTNGDYLELLKVKVETGYLRRKAPDVQSQYLKLFVNAGGDENLRNLAVKFRQQEIERLRQEGEFPSEEQIEKVAIELLKKGSSPDYE